MKPEEAIRVIEVAKAECEWSAPLDYQVAFDMAIEELKEQPEHNQNTPQKQPDLDTFGAKTGETCSDAISRQDAIDIILDDKIDDTSLKVMTALGDGRLALTLNDACDRHIRAIEQLPFAQPEQHWISCSERLPEDREWYLGIFKEPDTGWINPIPFICDYVGRKTMTTTKDCWTLKGFTDRKEYIDYYFNLECVAWMPLPESYKEAQ